MICRVQAMPCARLVSRGCAMTTVFAGSKQNSIRRFEYWGVNKQTFLLIASTIVRLYRFTSGQTSSLRVNRTRYALGREMCISVDMAKEKTRGCSTSRH